MKDRYINWDEKLLICNSYFDIRSNSYILFINKIRDKFWFKNIYTGEETYYSYEELNKYIYRNSSLHEM